MQEIITKIAELQENNKIPHKSHEHALEMLGRQDKVTKFSNFYDENKYDIDIIRAGLITHYILENEVDSKQAQSFKDGVFLFANFFKQCKIETSIRNEAERDGEIETMKA